MAFLEPCVTPAYSEPCHTQNPGIFRTRDILCISQNSVKAYSDIFRTLWNARILRTLPYLELSIFRILPYFGSEVYSEICESSKTEGLTKLVNGYNYSSTTSHLSCLTRLWRRFVLNKCCVPCSVTLDYVLQAFFINNTYISNTRLELAKNQAKLSNTLGLNFYYLENIRILHPCCHPKM